MFSPTVSQAMKKLKKISQQADAITDNSEGQQPEQIHKLKQMMKKSAAAQKKPETTYVVAKRSKSDDEAGWNAGKVGEACDICCLKRKRPISLRARLTFCGEANLIALYRPWSRDGSGTFHWLAQLLNMRCVAIRCATLKPILRQFRIVANCGLSGNGQHQKRPAGAKGKVKFVDPRMRCDVDGMKRAELKKKGKGSGKKSKPKPIKNRVGHKPRSR